MSAEPLADVRVHVLGVRSLSPTVVSLELRCEQPQLPRWEPGQHVELVTSSPARRIPYSVASFQRPTSPAELELAVAIDGARELLAEIEAGAALFVSPPRGTFVWRPAPGHSLLVGIGTGVSPLRAMLQAALAHDPLHRISLLYGARNEAELLWGDEFRKLASAHASFQFEPTLSSASANWQGRIGWVQAHLEGLAAPLLPALTAYVCGHPTMVDDCARRLTVGLGVPPTQVFCEAY